LHLSPAVSPLAVAMIEPPFGTLLVPAVGAASLTEPRLLAAGETAIALPAITGGTQKEQRATVAMQTNPWSQNYFARSRHAYSQAALDNGYGSMSG
jgi:hypothetical protein